jgi:hypothetical protein
MITAAERRFPVRIRIAVPPQRLGQQHARIIAWLDENCGADGWAMTPSGTRGALNDAVSIYFPDRPGWPFANFKPTLRTSSARGGVIDGIRP